MCVYALSSSFLMFSKARIAQSPKSYLLHGLDWGEEDSTRADCSRWEVYPRILYICAELQPVCVRVSLDLAMEMRCGKGLGSVKYI